MVDMNGRVQSAYLVAVTVPPCVRVSLCLKRGCKILEDVYSIQTGGGCHVVANNQTKHYHTLA